RARVSRAHRFTRTDAAPAGDRQPAAPGVAPATSSVRKHDPHTEVDAAMTQVQFEEANIIAPVLNTDNHKAQLALDVDTAGDSYDLSTLLTNWSRGHFIELTAEGGDVYYAFGPNDAGAIDETASDAGNTVC